MLLVTHQVWSRRGYTAETTYKLVKLFSIINTKIRKLITVLGRGIISGFSHTQSDIVDMLDVAVIFAGIIPAIVIILASCGCRGTINIVTCTEIGITISAEVLLVLVCAHKRIVGEESPLVLLSLMLETQSRLLLTASLLTIFCTVIQLVILQENNG